ncbi:MAG TPA: PilZ domain-containing protein [Thermoanaerobaculia bacterium]|nr:PilZ domain-containing protein [Thermoanaerobaculia bacterium]
MAIPVERRKYQRVVLTRPLAGRLGGARVYILDASLIGLRVAHQGTVPPAGSPCRIEFEWEGRAIELDCEVRRNALHKLAKEKNEKSIYHAGLSIVGALGDSDAALRTMIAAIVARALDEQKANARGVPAEAAQCFQTGKGSEYVRCELVDGTWRRSETNRSDQPMNGFTVSANESREHVQMLCDTFLNADGDGRQLIRMMAELSISQAEGVPTRRYVP